MIGRRLVGPALALLAALSPPAPSFALPECGVPADLMAVDEKLPRLAETLRAGAPVRIVAVGGASTLGAAAGSPDLAYPHRLQEALARAYPEVPVTVVNKGVARQTAEEMLARFPSDVFPEKPVLVIWEAGTTDAVHGVDVDEFATVLQTGIDALKARAIDVVLVNMQFSHSTVAVIDFERYLQAMSRVGDVNDVYVFPRFEMMRYWSQQNVFNFDGVAKDQRASLAAAVYDCLGRNLAAAIRIAVQ